MNLRPLPLPFCCRVLLPLVLAAHAAAAQVGDRGVLVIRADGREAGLETFQVTSGSTGYRVVTKVVYPIPRPGVEFSASLDRNAGSDGAIQVGRISGSVSAETYGVLKPSRLTIRRVERGAERASESPGGPGIVLLADSLFALYLQIVPLATEQGRSLTAVLLQTARRTSFTAQRVTDSAAGTSVVHLSGGLDGDIKLGPRGELLRITIPALGLEAIRKPD